MSLNQGRLTESEKKRVRESLSDAQKQNESAKKYAQMAERLVKESEASLKAAQDEKNLRMKAEHLREADTSFSDTQSSLSDAKMHTGEAHRTMIVAANVIGDRKEGVPQFIEFPLSGTEKRKFRFKRVGGLYKSRTEALQARQTMGLSDHGADIVTHEITSGKNKGKFTIYLLDEPLTLKQKRRYRIGL